ncbi:BrnT family toxin [Burkholderia sp. LMU1-1-1.1]|uniref:BrnT family toxin n=1 Tax=Burkholderia sp. LMU1-1-1.1 TaxID=3135266 RepID=UPI00344274BF
MTTYTWDEAKRKSNLRKHGLDFADAPAVLENDSYSTEDTRFSYGERRYNALGYFQGNVVSITYTEQNDEIRIISFRWATRRERRDFTRRVCRLD